MQRARTGLARVLAWGLCVCVIWSAQTVYGGVDFERLLTALTQRWGAGVTTKFNAWQTLVLNNKAAGDAVSGYAERRAAGAGEPGDTSRSRVCLEHSGLRGAA